MVKRTDDLTKDFNEHENHICYSEGGWPLLDEHWEDCGETQIKLLDIREFSSYKDYLIQRVKKVFLGISDFDGFEFQYFHSELNFETFFSSPRSPWGL